MAGTDDKAGRPIVVVTGMGIVTSLGTGIEDNWRKLTAGESGIRPIGRFATEGLKTRIAGTVDFVPVEPLCGPALCERMGEMAAQEAVSQSGIGSRGRFPGPLFVAVPPNEVEWPQRQEMGALARGNDAFDYDNVLRTASTGAFSKYGTRFLFASIADRLADAFGTQGSPISVTTACASGASAIQLGLEAIRRCETDAALCVGTDGTVNPETLIRFSLLSALSTQNDPAQAAAKPFSKNRDGFVMAEGAAALVLESLAAAKARGAKILGVIAGCGEMADSFHRTRSSPDGKPIIASVRNAIADAGLAPDDIDYINAHGTGTPENDKMEYLGLATVLGERTKDVPVSSNKSMIGHTLSAAGTVEAVFTLLTLAHQRIPPTINYQVPDPSIPLDVVPNAARDASVAHALSNSFGFGGQNVSLVMSREAA
ncbi:MAG TPA: beta-ketoacyl-ACP synthase [Xanthobacteraceae bacterium]|nr:beta-ketoacyl-ACP synthase [Xanthobacteraceae bacterium]